MLQVLTLLSIGIAILSQAFMNEFIGWRILGSFAMPACAFFVAHELKPRKMADPTRFLIELAVLALICQFPYTFIHQPAGFEVNAVWGLLAGAGFILAIRDLSPRLQLYCFPLLFLIFAWSKFEYQYLAPCFVAIFYLFMVSHNTRNLRYISCIILTSIWTITHPAIENILYPLWFFAIERVILLEKHNKAIRSHINRRLFYVIYACGLFISAAAKAIIAAA